MRKHFGLFIFIIFQLAVSAAQKIAFDPTDVNLGARALSLGGTFVTRYEDPQGIFLNPAQLATLSKSSLNLTGSQLLGEIYHFYGGGTYPLGKRLGLGIGLIYSNQSGGNIRDVNNMTFGNSILQSESTFLIGLGSRISSWWADSPRKMDLAWGLRYKYISNNMEAIQAQGSGMALELGLQYFLSKDFEMGFFAQNLISTGIQYQVSNELLEKKYYWGASWYWPEMHFRSTWESYLGQYTPMLMNLGAEWEAFPNLFFRVGMTQTQESAQSSTASANISSVQSYLTMGIGYLSGPYGFHYAYIPRDSTIGDHHYITVTLYEPSEAGELCVDQPKTDYLSFVPSTYFSGRIKFRKPLAITDPGYLQINDQDVPLSRAFTFSTKKLLSPGENVFKIKYFDSNGFLSKEEVLRVYYVPARLVWDSPQDKTVSFDGDFAFKAHLEFEHVHIPSEIWNDWRREMGSLKLNQKSVSLNSAYQFESQETAKIGKNKWTLSWVSDDQEIVDAQPLRILRLKNFEDISQNGPWTRLIQELGSLLLVNTPNQMVFHPSRDLKRREMLAYLLNVLRWKDHQVEATQRVEALNSEENFSQFLKKENIAQMIGYPDKKFRPTQMITRAETAALMARFQELFEGVAPSRNHLLFFSDFTKSHWAYDSAYSLKGYPLWIWLNDQKFLPRAFLKKYQMAVMLYNTPYISRKIYDLYDWESY